MAKESAPQNYTINYSPTSSPPKLFGKSMLLPLTTENGIANFVCYELRNTHCRRIQSLSHGILHPRGNATCILYIILHCPIPPQKRNLLFHNYIC